MRTIENTLVDENGVTQEGAITEGDFRGMKENWNPGDKAYFEYHCNESHDSADAQAWYRSHQVVTILSRCIKDDIANGVDGCSVEERFEYGCPSSYECQFEDGFIWTVMEDELSTTFDVWERPNPPAPRN